MKKAVSAYNPANLLSLGRIVLVPFFVVALKEGRDLTALILFATASVSDFLDGQLARRFGWESRLGEFIDPLGDKMLTLSAFVLLTLQARMPFWVAVLAVTRELIVISGYLLLALLAGRTELKVSQLGKWSTLLQMLALNLFLAWPFLNPGGGENVLALAAVEGGVVLNFLGGLDYALRGIHDFEKGRRAKKT